MFRHAIQFLSVMLLVCALHLTVLSQSATATLSGFVADENGGFIAKTDIEVLNNATALLRKTKTNDEGYFTVPLLPPGNYSLTASFDGFQRLHHPNIILNVNDTRSILLPMKPGSINETITIIGEVPLLKDSPAVSTVVDRQFVENLPLNGRSFQSLISITPGVTLTVACCNPGQFSVNGQRADTNYFFMVDGVSANFGISGNNISTHGNGSLPAYAIFGGTNNLVSVDALEEFRIQTSGNAPELGRTPGGQILLVTRSGSNTFHGTVFNYLRNEALDANNWFANQQGVGKAPMRQNDFGGVLGGPLHKKHTFFFFSYEGLRLRLPQFQTVTVPSLSLRAAVPEGIRPYLNLFPRPNRAEMVDAQGNPSGLAPFSASYSDPTTFNATSLRIDHSLKGKLNFLGRYNHAPSSSGTRISSLNTIFDGQLLTRTMTGGVTWVINPKLDNELRVNWSGNDVSTTHELDDYGGAAPLPDSALFPAFAPRATSRFTFRPTGTTGIVTGRFWDNAQRQFNLVNNLSYKAGPHQMKFGIDYRRMTPRQSTFNYQMSNSGTVANMRAGRASTTETGDSGPYFPIFTNLSLYAQDNWRVTRRLTLTYGLRWDYNPPPSEKNGRYPYAVINLDNPAQASLDTSGTPYWKATRDNFAPRIGLAWQLSDGPWARVVRGGFGVFYDLGSENAGYQVYRNAVPFVASRRSTGAVPFPPNFAAIQPLTFGNPPWQVRGFDPAFKLPYTLQWNFAVEQLLGNSQSLTATYVGAAGRRLPYEETHSIRSVNPNFNFVTRTINAATADYHGLQLQYQRRLARGLQALVAYTWAHSIDSGSDLFNSSSPLGLVDISRERGSSDFDVRHSVAASLSWNLPTWQAGALLKALTGNWSADTIIRARTAPPIFAHGQRPDLVQGQPIFLADPNVAGGRKLNPAAFANPQGPQGTLGRNALRAFGFSQVDLALNRQFKLRERLRLQFRAEFFNLLNHPNFGAPDLTFFDSPTGGAIEMLNSELGSGIAGQGLSPLYQVGAPRSVQLSLKLIF